MVISNRNLIPGCIHHSDRGVQYASSEYVDELRGIFDSYNLYFALSRAKEVVEKYKNIYPEFAEKLEMGVEQTLTCYHFPSSNRKRIRTANSLERFNKEIKKRTRVIRIFPNEASSSSSHLYFVYREK